MHVNQNPQQTAATCGDTSSKQALIDEFIKWADDFANRDRLSSFVELIRYYYFLHSQYIAENPDKQIGLSRVDESKFYGLWEINEALVKVYELANDIEWIEMQSKINAKTTQP
jgi:hypothetical protein